MLDLLFKEFDITGNEIGVYLALAESGKSAAASIAKKLQLPRSSVYTLLDSLNKKGLISVEQAQDCNYYLPNKPNVFQRIVESEKRRYSDKIKRKEETAIKLASALDPYFKQQNYGVPRLRFFEGTANIETMLYENCPAWQQSIAKYDLTWWGYQDHLLVENYRQWLNHYWSTLMPGEKIQLLSNKAVIESKLKGKIQGRQIKLIPKKFNYSSTIWVLGDYVVTIMTRQKPHYAILLQDSVFAANQRITFKMLWELI